MDPEQRIFMETGLTQAAAFRYDTGHEEGCCLQQPAPHYWLAGYFQAGWL